MSWYFDIIDLSIAQIFTAAFEASAPFGLENPLFELRLSNTPEEFKNQLSKGTTAGIMIVTDEFSPIVGDMIDSFYAKVGAFNDHICVLCSDPTPTFMASLFEYGVDCFVGQESWQRDAKLLLEKINGRLGDETCAFYKSINLQKALAQKDKKQITQSVLNMSDETRYDYRIAVAVAKGYEALGETKNAIEAFEQGKVLNRNYRPLLSDLGEALIADGQFDRGLMIIKQLERTNPTNVDRKTQLVNALVAKGDFAAAQQKVDELGASRPDLQLVKELQTHLYLADGRFENAISAMDNMHNVGDAFAAKLNEHGIRLAKEGKGKSALMLYQKAHQIVRPDLKYKISLNGALACYRVKAFSSALKFIDRCEIEYGKPFPKSQKLRIMIAEAQAQAKTQAQTPTPAEQKAEQKKEAS